MASALPHHSREADTEAAQARHALERARSRYFEDPAGALVEAIRCHELGCSVGDASLCASARALQGSVSLHRGDLRGALALAVEAERHAESAEDLSARAEAAALKAQVGFFTGSFAEALRQAELAVGLADQAGDPALRIFTRRATCVVFGNVGVRDLRERLEALLELTLETGDSWAEAVARNDLACNSLDHGDVAAAEAQIEHALRVASSIPPPNGFVCGIAHSTRADIHLAANRPADALADAEHALALLSAPEDPNPYVLGATVRAEVQARMALGQYDDAQQSGEGALSWLGDRMPQTRSLILSTLAGALRDAGRVEQAYDALARAAELERRAFHELSELQLGLERATLEISAARRESAVLAAKNRQLADAHAELERRTIQLEELQEQLREQAERDWLTGLHNRRFLARELERLAHEQLAVPLSLSVLDLDHFKSVNDQFGHHVGDQVLVRVAGLLCDILRESDIVVRSGGEEFVVLMPATEARAATACCERIREAISAEDWSLIAEGLTVTTSAGVATTHDPADGLQPLVKLADERLYDAKRAGRNRVV